VANKKGFTLLEIILTITIITILLAIMVPNVLRYLGRTDEAVCRQNRQTILQAYHIYKATVDPDCALSDVLDGTCTLLADQHLENGCPTGGVYTVNTQNSNSFIISCSVHKDFTLIQYTPPASYPFWPGVYLYESAEDKLPASYTITASAVSLGELYSIGGFAGILAETYTGADGKTYGTTVQFEQSAGNKPKKIVITSFEMSADRSGFTNTGGYSQYTLPNDVDLDQPCQISLQVSDKGNGNNKTLTVQVTVDGQVVFEKKKAIDAPPEDTDVYAGLRVPQRFSDFAIEY